MSQLLSKKNSLECMTTEDSKFVLFPADGFSDEQVTAMQSARSSLPRDFQCLSPILEKLLTTFENRNKNVAPRMKAPQVSKTSMQDGYVDILIIHSLKRRRTTKLMKM